MVAKKVNKKKIFIASGVFLILLLYLLIFETKFEEMEKKKNKVFDYTLADINSFELIKKDAIIALERKGNDWLIIKPYKLPASKSDVESFLIDVRDIHIDKIVTKDASNLEQYGLTSPKIRLNLFLGKKKEHMLGLLLGNKNPDYTGHYAKVENRPYVYILENFAESILDKDLTYFRDKDVFKVDANSINRIDVKFDKESYVIKKEKLEWTLLKPVSITNLPDQDVKKIINSLLDLRVKTFYDIKDKNYVTQSDAGLLSPTIIINLFDNKNKTYTLEIGKEKENTNEYYAKTELYEVVGVDKYMIDELKKNIIKLKDLKKSETSVTNKAKTRELKSEEK